MQSWQPLDANYGGYVELSSGRCVASVYRSMEKLEVETLSNCSEVFGQLSPKCVGCLEIGGYIHCVLNVREFYFYVLREEFYVLCQDSS